MILRFHRTGWSKFFRTYGEHLFSLQIGSFISSAQFQLLFLNWIAISPRVSVGNLRLSVRVYQTLCCFSLFLPAQMLIWGTSFSWFVSIHFYFGLHSDNMFPTFDVTGDCDLLFEFLLVCLFLGAGRFGEIINSIVTIFSEFLK